MTNALSVRTISEDPFQRTIYPPLVEQSVSWGTKLKRTWQLIVELGFKEFYNSIVKSTINLLSYCLNKHRYNLNTPLKVREVTTITLMVHGQGGGPFCFMSLAKHLHNKGHDNLRAPKFNATTDNPIPTDQLKEEIDRLVAECKDNGATQIRINIVGHSLGGTAAFKYAYSPERTLDPSVTLRVIGVGARLYYYKPHPMSWFCHGREINEAYENFWRYQNAEGYRETTQLRTIRGEKDGLMKGSMEDHTDEAAHIQGIPEYERTVAGAGHGGVINLASNEIAEFILEPWAEQQQERIEA